jgi:hypothetical protein
MISCDTGAAVPLYGQLVVFVNTRNECQNFVDYGICVTNMRHQQK